MDISKHAEKRIRKRIGIPRKAVGKFVDEAMKNGVPLKDFKGRIKKFYEYTMIKYHSGNESFFYREFLFIAHNGTLVTVYPIPKNIKQLSAI